MGFTVPFAAECLSDSSCRVDFSVLSHFHLATECSKTDSATMLYLLTRGSCSCNLMGPFAFQSRNHLLVCVNVCMFITSSRKGAGLVISTLKFNGITTVSLFWLRAYEPNMYVLNDLYATI